MSENKSKGDRDFAEWLGRIEDGDIETIPELDAYYEAHGVPSDEELHEYSSFQQFITGEGRRRELVRQQLEQSLPLRSTAD